MINKIIMTGRLVKDPALKFSQAGKAVCFFCLAVNKNFENAEGQKEASYVDIVVFGKKAENVGNALAKGQLIGIEGNLNTRVQEKDGVKNKITEVILENFHFLEKKK